MIHGPLPHRTSSPNHRSRPSRKSRRFEPMKNSWALFFLGSKHDVILSLSKSERSAEDQALLMFCAITRGQWFNDGNKRTALMAANHVLINAGIGVFAISPSLKRDFTNRLLRYYEIDGHVEKHDWTTGHESDIGMRATAPITCRAAGSRIGMAQGSAIDGPRPTDIGANASSPISDRKRKGPGPSGPWTI